MLPETSNPPHILAVHAHILALCADYVVLFMYAIVKCTITAAI